MSFFQCGITYSFIHLLGHYWNDNIVRVPHFATHSPKVTQKSMSFQFLGIKKDFGLEGVISFSLLGTKYWFECIFVSIQLLLRRDVSCQHPGQIPSCQVNDWHPMLGKFKWLCLCTHLYMLCLVIHQVFLVSPEHVIYGQMRIKGILTRSNGLPLSRSDQKLLLFCLKCPPSRDLIRMHFLFYSILFLHWMHFAPFDISLICIWH